jgi:membrane protein implicated in regulation of membrane protease activity
MTSWFSEISPFVVFLLIAGVGFVFLLISLLFGEIFEHFEMDHDIDAGPSFFSSRVLSVFITAFGGCGALASHFGMGMLGASAVGMAGGAVFGSMIYWFARFLFSQQASTELQASDLAGKAGRVVVSIPADGVGQVRCQVGEEMVDRIARSKDGTAIGANSLVIVEQVMGELLVVRRQ